MSDAMLGFINGRVAADKRHDHQLLADFLDWLENVKGVELAGDTGKIRAEFYAAQRHFADTGEWPDD